MIHKNAEWDALAALCALSEGKFKEYRDSMYALEDQKHGGEVTDSERVSLAKNIWLNTQSFEKCLKEGWYQKTLNKEVQDGDVLKVEGTPSFYLGNTLMQFTTPDQFFSILDAAIKK